MTQLSALGWTLGIEVPIVALLVRSKPLLNVLWIGAGASLLTHPFAWHFAAMLSPDEYVHGVYVIEVIVTLIEGVWYRLWFQIGWKYSMIVSAVANASSFLLGWWGIV